MRLAPTGRPGVTEQPSESTTARARARVRRAGLAVELPPRSKLPQRPTASSIATDRPLTRSLGLGGAFGLREKHPVDPCFHRRLVRVGQTAFRYHNHPSDLEIVPDAS
jgi:hypothetical protein